MMEPELLWFYSVEAAELERQRFKRMYGFMPKMLRRGTMFAVVRPAGVMRMKNKKGH